jgi:hypothetical protein
MAKEVVSCLGQRNPGYITAGQTAGQFPSLPSSCDFKGIANRRRNGYWQLPQVRRFSAPFLHPDFDEIAD